MEVEWVESDGDYDVFVRATRGGRVRGRERGRFLRVRGRHGDDDRRRSFLVRFQRGFLTHLEFGRFLLIFRV